LFKLKNRQTKLASKNLKINSTASVLSALDKNEDDNMKKLKTTCRNTGFWFGASFYRGRQIVGLGRVYVDMRDQDRP